MHTFSSLKRHRNYRLYFFGQLISQLGSWQQNAAQAWLVLELTGSAQAVGVVGFCLWMPYAIFGLFGGAVADRFDRRRLLLVTQSALAFCAFALAVVTYLHLANVWVIDAIAALRGTILVLNNPSRQALIVQLVGRDELPNAIAINSSLINATRIVGPALAGILIATTGVATCFLLNAISFLAVIAAIIVMRPAEFRSATGGRPRLPLLHSVAEGLRYARRRKTVAVALGMLFVVSLVSINFSVLLPVVARLTLHGGAQIFGAITACFGAGAFAGALTTASRGRASARVLIAAATGLGVAELILAAQSSVLGVSLALFATGICYTTYTANTNALVQMATPGFLQGRIAGLYGYLFLASGPFGSLLVGYLSERFGTGSAFLAGGIAALCMALVGVVTQPWPMPHRKRAIRP